MNRVRWGIIGCGDVTEVKSGPGFQKADGSALTAVMRRDEAKARDYARRHGVPRIHTRASDLISDPEVDAVYVATPPSTHCELALAVAAAGKPCLVEKPMAMSHAESIRMVEAFASVSLPLWVAFYRRALPRFTLVKHLLESEESGQVTSVHVEVVAPLTAGDSASAWRFDPAVAGAGLFFDLASHCFDLLDFLLGPVTDVAGIAVNTGRAYDAEDVTGATFNHGGRVIGTGIWNFNASRQVDRITQPIRGLIVVKMQRHDRSLIIVILLASRGNCWTYKCGLEHLHFTLLCWNCTVRRQLARRQGLQVVKLVVQFVMSAVDKSLVGRGTKLFASSTPLAQLAPAEVEQEDK